MAALLLLTALAGLAFGETEVSGEVSGEWTVEGSPFIVVDSTWVPEGDILSIRSGVLVLSAENKGIYVYGSISAEGTEEDSVRFDLLVSIGDSANITGQSWRGIFLGDHSYTNELEWATIKNALWGLTMDEYSRVNILHSTVFAYRAVIGTTDTLRRKTTEGQQIIVSNCELIAPFSIGINAGRIIIDSSEIWGIRNEVGTLTVTNSAVRGSIISSAECKTEYHNCDVTPSPYDTSISVTVGSSGSQMVKCYIQGNVLVHSFDNELIDSCTIEGDLLADNFSGIISNTLILGDKFRIYGYNNIVIRDCNLGQVGITIDEGNSVLELEGNNIRGDYSLVKVFGCDHSLIVKENTFINGLHLVFFNIGSSASIENNTFITMLPDSARMEYGLWLGVGNSNSLTMRNNIFLGDGDGGTVFFLSQMLMVLILA
jgi:hypothetical protein